MSELVELTPDGDGGDAGVVNEILVVTVPPGAVSGEPIILDLDGKTVEFIIPPGCTPGDEIEVMPEQLTERREEQDVNMFITVPPGASSGDTVTIEYNGRMLDYIIPSGAREGDEIEISPDELDGCHMSAEVDSVEQAKEEITVEQDKDIGIESVSSSVPDVKDVEYATVDINVPHDIPSGELLTFEVSDGRKFSVPILEGVSSGDILTIQLPEIIADADDEYLTVKLPDSEQDEGSKSIMTVVTPTINRSETKEECENKIVRTIVEEREDGTIITTVETTTTLSDGNREIETETTVTKPRKHKSLREKRQQMLEWKMKMEEKEGLANEEATNNFPSPPRKIEVKPSSKVLDEATVLAMYSDADEFYKTGEVRAGGRYAYNHGMYSEGSEKEGEVNPYMPDVKPSLPADYYKTTPEPKEKIDVEESRKRTMSRSAAITQFEEDRAAVFDEDGNERPSGFMVIALEAVAIVNTRKAEGGNVNLNALVAKDEQKIKVRIVAAD